MSSEDTNNTKENEHTCCGGHHHGEEKDAPGKEFNLDDIPDVPLPAPTLVALATSIAQQAMVSMGIFPHPLTGKSHFMMNQTRHLIDTVALIFEKTAGNRSAEESKTLDSLLHDLRMMFIAAQNEQVARKAQQQSADHAGDTGKKSE